LNEVVLEKEVSMEEILKLKVKFLKTECSQRNLSTKGKKFDLAKRLQENGYQIASIPIEAHLLPEDHLENYVVSRNAERDASSLVKMIKTNIHEDDNNKNKRLVFTNFSRLAYHRYIERHGKKRRTLKKVKRLGQKMIHARHHHTFKQVTRILEDMEGKNGFIKLDQHDTNYWNFDYETICPDSEVVTGKVTLRELKFCYDEEDEILRVSIKYDGFWKQDGCERWKCSI
jgi:hypothetical protein